MVAPVLVLPTLLALLGLSSREHIAIAPAAPALLGALAADASAIGTVACVSSGGANECGALGEKLSTSEPWRGANVPLIESGTLTQPTPSTAIATANRVLFMTRLHLLRRASISRIAFESEPSLCMQLQQSR